MGQSLKGDLRQTLMWKTAQYAIIGRGHERTQVPCQDKTYSLKRNGATVIALADGAGSAALSHLGAETATKTIAHELADHFDDLIQNPDGQAVKEQVLQVLLDALNQTAESNQCSLQDLACTLLVTAIKEDAFLLIHLGDGIVAMVKNQQLKLASAPDNGEFANSTYFVTSKSALRHMKLFKGSTQDFSGFALMSDGTAESFYHRKSGRLSTGVKKMLDLSALLSDQKYDEFLDASFKQVIRNNTQDDCSIAIITNQALAAKTYQGLDPYDRYDLFEIKPVNKAIAEKRLRKFERILTQLSKQPARIENLSKHLHIKKKYLRRDLEILVKHGLATKEDGIYNSDFPSV